MNTMKGLNNYHHKKLGLKKIISNDEWVKCWSNIEKIISYQEIRLLTEKTLIEIYKNTKGRKFGYGYSGGKDSIVLGHLLMMLDGKYKQGYLVTNDLQYPDFKNWVDKNIFPNVITHNTGTNIEWLSKHEEMLFPTDRVVVNRYSLKTHKLQHGFFKDNNLDLFLTGRRTQDGNNCGKSLIYKKSNGMVIYNPLKDWSHEELLGFIHYNNLAMPPIYDWKNGFVEGSHPWNLRSHTYTIEGAWDDIYTIDKSIVINASNYLKSASECLIRNNY